MNRLLATVAAGYVGDAFARAFSLAAVAALTFTTGAEAATFKPIYKGYSLVMTGTIVAGDDRRLVAAYNGSCDKYRRCPERIFLNSDGGDIRTAFQLGDLIRSVAVHTVVGKTDECYSACVTVFAAGLHRVIFTTSRLGVHRAVDRYGQEDVTFSIAWAQLMRDAYGTPASIVGKLMLTPPTGISMLDWNDLAGWVEIVFDDSNPAPRTSSPPPKRKVAKASHKLSHPSEAIERDLPSRVFRRR